MELRNRLYSFSFNIDPVEFLTWRDSTQILRET